MIRNLLLAGALALGVGCGAGPATAAAGSDTLVTTCDKLGQAIVGGYRDRTFTRDTTLNLLGAAEEACVQSNDLIERTVTE